jgi:hypothetical protein
LVEIMVFKLCRKKVIKFSKKKEIKSTRKAIV